MRVGLVAGMGVTIDSFFPEILDMWRRYGWHVEVAVGPDGPSSSDGNTTILSGLSRRPSCRNVRAPRQLREWVSGHDLDLVITNTATTSLVVRSSGLSVPVVYFCHGLHWQEPDKGSARLWATLEAHALRHTAGVICLNSDDQQWFRLRAPAKPILRLAHGVGLDTNSYTRSSPPPLDDCLRLVWIGEFSRRKRPMHAIKTVQELKARGLPVTLTMLGDGPLLKRARDNVAQIGLADAVKLVGRQDVAGYLSSAHALLHTATWEGLPRVGLEAAAIGRAVIAYDTKGTRDLPGVVLAERQDPVFLAQTVESWVAAGQVVNTVQVSVLKSETAAHRIRLFAAAVVMDAGT